MTKLTHEHSVHTRCFGMVGCTRTDGSTHFEGIDRRVADALTWADGWMTGRGIPSSFGVYWLHDHKGSLTVYAREFDADTIRAFELAWKYHIGEGIIDFNILEARPEDDSDLWGRYDFTEFTVDRRGVAMRLKPHHEEIVLRIL